MGEKNYSHFYLCFCGPWWCYCPPNSRRLKIRWYLPIRQLVPAVSKLAIYTKGKADIHTLSPSRNYPHIPSSSGRYLNIFHDHLNQLPAMLVDPYWFHAWPFFPVLLSTAAIPLFPLSIIPFTTFDVARSHAQHFHVDIANS